VPDDLSRHVARWAAAGVIDAATAERITAFERAHAARAGLRWPVLIALAFGALLLGSGVLLFVAAHWDTLSPAARVALVLLLVAFFHVAGALVGTRLPGMSSALHAAGTAALGAGIFLAGQIFNLDEHWPGGVMLWALGAAAAWGLLRQRPQLALTAVLTPAWLASEWMVAAGWSAAGVMATGLFTLALAYFTGPRGPDMSRVQGVLWWIGGVALAPAGIYFAAMAGDRAIAGRVETPAFVLALGWIVAAAGPLVVAAALRGERAWINAVAAAWAVLSFGVRQGAGEAALFAWCALGAVGLVAWGVHEMRRERINMGAALFALTILAFYFSNVMDKLGRSASLIGLGVLFLAGGSALERVRRRLIQQTRDEP
jgi:uncharacterized membrane protein